MNRYIEAIAVGTLASAATFVVGVGTGSSTAAAKIAAQTPAVTRIAAIVSHPQAAARTQRKPLVAGHIAPMTRALEGEVRK